MLILFLLCIVLTLFNMATLRELVVPYNMPSAIRSNYLLRIILLEGTALFNFLIFLYSIYGIINSEGLIGILYLVVCAPLFMILKRMVSPFIWLRILLCNAFSPCAVTLILLFLLIRN